MVQSSYDDILNMDYLRERRTINGEYFADLSHCFGDDLTESVRIRHGEGTLPPRPCTSVLVYNSSGKIA